MKTNTKATTRNLLPLAIASLAIVSTLPASAATTAYQTAVLSNNPLAYYQFNEASGTTLDNKAASGATYDGTLQGTIILSQNGNGGASGDKAYDFGGGRITFGATLGSLTEWSVEAWMNYDSGTGSNSHIFGNDLGGWNDDVMIGMGPEGGLGGVGGGEFGLVHQGAPGSVREGAGAGMTADAWHHVVVTGSDSAGELKVYIDGALVDTNAVLTNDATLGNNAFTIGDKRAADGGGAYNGLLDELAIYDKALTLEQVNNNLNGIAVPEPSTTALLGLGGLALILRRRK